MSQAVCEWRKLFRLPALWVFLALYLAFNGLLIATLTPYDRAFFNETFQTAKALGQQVDEDFWAGLDAMPATENRDLLLESSPEWRTSLRRMTPGNLRISTPVW